MYALPRRARFVSARVMPGPAQRVAGARDGFEGGGGGECGDPEAALHLRKQGPTSL